MMTSRSEYRLVQRQDNADERLMPLGHELGLVSDEQYRRVTEKYEMVRREIARLEHTKVYELLKRPENTYDSLAPLDQARPPLPQSVRREVEISVKYAGYIRRQEREIEEFRRMESRRIPPEIDYDAVPGLRTEARQKLGRIRPENFGRAGRISGVSPADITALMIWVEKNEWRP